MDMAQMLLSKEAHSMTAHLTAANPSSIAFCALGLDRVAELDVAQRLSLYHKIPSLSGCTRKHFLCEGLVRME